jgi:diaminopimelate decarboxylase
MDASVIAYKGALRDYYPAESEITYAGKAFLCKAIAEWTQAHDLFVDCTGQGEIAIAVAGGVPRERIIVHGVNKSISDLQAAIEYSGTIVVDNLTELERISTLFSETSVTTQRRFPDIWLRLLPGVAVTTHHSHTQTGQEDSKFGMTREELLKAVRFCYQHNLPFNGIHFHQGSNFRDISPLLSAIELGLDIADALGLKGAWHFSPGGGWGVAYHESELPQPEIEDYVRIIAENVKMGCHKRDLKIPILHLEPGRSLVARAGVAIYRVGAVKRRAERTWLLTDGGMTDNPRHALYGAKYSCLTVAGVEREGSERVYIAGPHCESGDVVIEDLLMPRVEEGELIAIPVAGAYHLSMSSNYNGARKPAVLMLEDGRARVIIQRENVQDLLRNQV